MRPLFHAGLTLSIMTSMVMAAGMAQAAPAAPTHAIFARWATSEPAKAFTRRGADYRQIDIAPCGKDFCGVSVGAKGECGPVLFRFLMKHVDDFLLTGHGKWGSEKMNLGIELNEIDQPARYELLIGLGDNHYALESRSSSMPKFTSTYHPAGLARCTAR